MPYTELSLNGTPGGRHTFLAKSSIATVDGPIRVVAAMAYQPGAMAGRASRPGVKAAFPYRPGAMAGESVQ
jgi:hypothetical protein